MYKIDKQQENSRENGAENYIQYFVISYNGKEGLFQGGSVIKNLHANAGNTGDVGLISGLGRSP